jgi:hypothetical protein
MGESYKEAGMKAGPNWVIVLVAIIGLAGLAMAADNTSHTVTVTVNPINEINVTGGNITLTINAASAGSDPTAVTNNACHLEWTTNQANKKITVASDQTTPSFLLKVLATGATGGTPATEATLSNTDAKDLLTGVATTTGNTTLRFTATATAAQGTGTVTHTLTYTVTAAS